MKKKDKRIIENLKKQNERIKELITIWSMSDVVLREVQEKQVTGEIKNLESELSALESQEELKPTDEDIVQTVLLVLAQIKHNEECGKDNKFTIDEVVSIIKRRIIPTSKTESKSE